MAFKAAVASGVVLAGAEHVKLSYSDCGSSSTHLKVTGLKPDAIDTPGKAAIIGSGSLNSDQTSAHFSLKVRKAGISFFSGKGNICEDTSFKFPLGTASFTVKGLDCPVKAGNLEVEVDLDIPSELLEDGENSSLSIHIDANADDTGDQILCLDVDASLATPEPGLEGQRGGMCCYGRFRDCETTQRCDFTQTGCGVGAGQCVKGESCFSEQFQFKESCPSYCEWREDVPGFPNPGECVPAIMPWTTTTSTPPTPKFMDLYFFKNGCDDISQSSLLNHSYVLLDVCLPNPVAQQSIQSLMFEWNCSGLWASGILGYCQKFFNSTDCTGPSVPKPIDGSESGAVCGGGMMVCHPDPVTGVGIDYMCVEGVPPQTQLAI